MDCEKYTFDQQLLKNTMDKLYTMFNAENISDEKREILSSFTEHIRAFLTPENNEYAITFKKDIEDNELPKRLLAKMKKDYQSIDKRIMEVVFDLSSLINYSYTINKYNNTNLTPEIIINNSLEVYRAFLPHLLEEAQQIINEPKRLINFSIEEKAGSRCMLFGPLNLTFINVENYQKIPFNFIHELQHAIEHKKNYEQSIYYKETGSILAETLYIDKMIGKHDNEASNLYLIRINYIFNELDLLNSYFLALKELEKFNFDVSYTKLIDVLKKCKLILRNSGIKKVYETNYQALIPYLLSFLKSIELRKMIYQDHKLGGKQLEKIFLNPLEYKNRSSLLGAINFENYLNEVNRKAKCMSLNKNNF